MSLIAPCLCSVTRRHLTIDAVIALAVGGAVESVEWNDETHVPPGDREAAELAAKATAAAGLRIASYGSRFRVGAECVAEFDPALDSARFLGAPRIRVRAGGVSARRSTPAQWDAVVRDARLVADRAADVRVEVVFAQEEGTLADTAHSTARLLAEVDRPNVLACWQPRIGLSAAEAGEELDLLAPKVAGVHVFSWSSGRLRSPLADRAELWLDAVDRLAATARPVDVYLEFVPNDDPVALRREGASLRALVDSTRKPVRRRR
jgi:sugar phosphate isomerase/epimerase